MAKRLKLKFPRLIASFRSLQICRSRDPSTLRDIPSPAIYRVSTVNQRAMDTVYPPGYWRHLQHQNSILFINAGFRGSLYPSAAAPDHQQFRSGRRKVKAPASIARITFRTTNLRFREPKERRAKRKSVTSIPLGDCSWCSDVDEESEALLSFSRSFSKDTSLEFLSSSAEKAMELESKKYSEMENVKKARRLRRYALKTESTTGGSNASVLRRMVTSTAKWKVRESFAVVKRTEEPYEEFKKLMTEMILEKHIMEAEELQELLQCFLSPNSRLYHGVIVEAFSDIWEVLFCDSPWGHRASVGF